MHKSFAVLTIMTSVALAQSLIPTGISSSCSTFLNQLNDDKTVGACTAALAGATSAFAPGSDATKDPSTTEVASALGGLCDAKIDTVCSDSLIGAKITAFYSACAQELTSNLNADVLRHYDVLYSLGPFRTALCSKDDAGNYCATQSKLPSTTSDSALQKVLTISSSNLVLPNATTIKDSGLLFIFTQATAASPDLCTPCTRKIMNAYSTHESKLPYAPGLGKSTFLSGQASLAQAISNTCGASFLSEAGVVKAAGGLAGGSFTGTDKDGDNSGAFQAGASVLFVSMTAVLFAAFSAL